MIKQKLLQFLYWIKDHCFLLVEVVLRLYLGGREKDEIQHKGSSPKDEEGE